MVVYDWTHELVTKPYLQFITKSSLGKTLPSATLYNLPETVRFRVAKT